MIRQAESRRVLAALAGGFSYKSFEAARDLHDHCLHCSVATIEKQGMPVLRRWEAVLGYRGAKTEVWRYWIAPEHRYLAGKLPSGEEGLGELDLPDLGELDLPDLGELDLPDLGDTDLPDLGDAPDLDRLNASARTDGGREYVKGTP